MDVLRSGFEAITDESTRKPARRGTSTEFDLDQVPAAALLGRFDGRGAAAASPWPAPEEITPNR